MLQNSTQVRLIVSALLLWFSSTALMATHNRAGEISIEQVGNCVSSLRVKATIVTYTKASSFMVDRDSLDICWGDGSKCIRVARINGPVLGGQAKGELLENDTRKNIYEAFHTYPSRGTYIISMNDPNRNGGIINVNFPNSEQIRFHLQTVYTFPNPQIDGCNSTPVLLQPPIDIGCVGKVFIHNPNAFDRDGDSLAYKLIVPFAELNTPVPNYQFPNMISPGPRNNLRINERTGEIIWDAPQRAGEYNLAIIIVEYRRGRPLDTIVRDMQILIQSCDNQPPKIDLAKDEICVIAGQVIQFPVTATAPIEETRQRVRLGALGGPFEVTVSRATFLPNNNGYQNDPLTKIFRWATTCEHISEQAYSVVFRAVDDFYTRDSTGLSVLKTFRIKVVGPPPQGVRASPGNGFIDVTWDKPYSCDRVADNYFRGFTVWRRIGSSSFEPDTCTTGLRGRGYTKVTLIAIRDSLNGRYHYRDMDVEPGRTYCYRVLAEFARTTPGGRFAYNLIESLPSKEACMQLNRNLPLIIKTDVTTTGTSNGAVQVCWSKPKAADLDTLTNPGPYIYELLRAEGLTPSESAFQVIRRTSSATFKGANDTCFLDQGLNTLTNPYAYRVRFYVGRSSTTPLGSTPVASTVFLRVNSSDKILQLSWSSSTPWDNFAYTILRKNASGGFDSIATTTTTNYVDRNLVNGTEYCYKIRAFGSYGIQGVPNPLRNHSQEACNRPQDNVPPCAPRLAVSTICDRPVDCNDPRQVFNTLTWNRPTETCPEATDLAGYNVYYSPSASEPNFTRIQRITSPGTLRLETKPENGIAGCYAVTAFDQLNNESLRSNVVCVENCPSYSLPNTFTPNGDGQNELFKPYPFCFIQRIDLKIVNRWGQVVFKTTDPNIKWDGNNLQGEPLPAGTYYYVCQVFEQRSTGVVPLEKPLEGFIQLVK
jgi:gliding motility-associated-like protein